MKYGDSISVCVLHKICVVQALMDPNLTWVVYKLLNYRTFCFKTQYLHIMYVNVQYWTVSVMRKNDTIMTLTFDVNDK